MKTTQQIQRERIKYISQFIDGGKSENRYLDLGNVIDILDNYSREPNLIEEENVQYYITNLSRAVIHLLQRYEFHKEIIYDIGETSSRRQKQIEKLINKVNSYKAYLKNIEKEFKKLSIPMPKITNIDDEENNEGENNENNY